LKIRPPAVQTWTQVQLESVLAGRGLKGLVIKVVVVVVVVKRAWSRDHATSSVTAVLPVPGQRCGKVCLNSFGNRTSPSDSSNDR